MKVSVFALGLYDKGSFPSNQPFPYPQPAN